MKRSSYDVIAKTARCTALLPLLTGYLSIVFLHSFLLALAAIAVSFLPYLVGYNLFVRGWLLKRVNDT
jgi:uncharacterized membrane protein